VVLQSSRDNASAIGQAHVSMFSNLFLILNMGGAELQETQAQCMKVPTSIGCGALLVWSLYALVVSELVHNLPVCETLFFMFTTSFVAMSIRLTIKKQWDILFRQPLFIWIIGVIGICGSDFAYITAAKYAPPAHVDFIDYLWPFLVILFSGFLPKERFTLQHLIAGALGLFGVLLLLTGGKSFIGFTGDYLCGYLFALIGAFMWSAYTIISRYYQETPIEMVGMYCGIGAVVTLALHLKFEVWITPSFYEGALVVLLGLTSGIAYLLWAYGTQKGNIKLLGVLAYFTPVFSMGLLVLFGKEPISIALAFACMLVVSGVVVGSLDWSRIRIAFT
jgi:drug/metabolite transporter (DMT)-like permease